MFTALCFLLFAGQTWAQCLSLPNAFSSQLEQADRILEGKVVGQQSFLDENGNILTQNAIEVYRVFQGDLEFSTNVITEGGVFGDLMQVVTPSTQLQIGDYGVLVLGSNEQRDISDLATNFIQVNEQNNSVFGLKEITEREQLYDAIARTTGSNQIHLLRIPLGEVCASRSTPQINSVYPLEVTAGTKALITISGQGFGENQESSRVAFHNADDGGQSFVGLNPGPHYVGWSDTEIQIYVPSSTLYNTTVAGTGSIRVIKGNGSVAESESHLTVNYAKSEVVYSESLNETMLIAMQQGGYEFTANQNLLTLLGESELIAKSIEKWACNTGVNFNLVEGHTAVSEFAQDDVNVIGLSNPGQFPNYLLGRTITTFSSCGTSNGLQWNLVEVDILLNSDIDWWLAETNPAENTFDIETALLHELGHAHLLQHNNDSNSPMYFELTQGAARRDLHLEADIQGGYFVSSSSADADHTCSAEYHQLYDFSSCNLSVINAVDETETNSILVYPNPFADELSLSGDWLAGTEYSVIDATGRLVLSNRLNGTSNAIQTAMLSKGVYLLKIESEGKVVVQRIVKN